MCTPYPEFVLTGVICIEKALKGNEIVYVLINRSFVLSVFVLRGSTVCYFQIQTLAESECSNFLFL